MSNTSENTQRSARVVTIRLRIPALIVAVAILIMGLVWSFVLGIMVGRGQINERLNANEDQFAQIMMEEPAAAPDDPIGGLIKPEDLQFKESLSQLPEEPARPASPPPATQTGRTAPPQAAQPAPVPPPAVQQGGQMFAYTYQVASYRKESQANELVSKLNAQGVKTTVESSTVNDAIYYRVLIHFEGDDSTVTQMKTLLKNNFKINDMLPRGKKTL